MQLLTCQNKTALKERLYHDAYQTVMHLSLQKGQEIPEHHGGDAEVTVIPVRGAIVFTASGQSEHLVPGKLVHLNAKELHSVRAEEDSEVILVKSAAGPVCGC
jgi:quercetin dioxygenase-like cupin family protein